MGMDAAGRDWLDPEALAALAPAAQTSLAGRTAIVTGAGGGLGRWLAAGLAAAGADLVLTDLDPDALEAVRAPLAGTVGVELVVADVAAADAPETIVRAARAATGRVDVLVNCAGINRREALDEVDPARFDQIVGVDLKAPLFLARTAAAAMRDGGRGGSIVNVTSVSAAFALDRVGLYAAAKAGLAQLTRVMALEWGQHGIRANALAPGFLHTPLTAPLWADDDRRRWLLNRLVIQRPGEPRDMVGACVLLASDASAYITGQTIYADGGFLAGGRWSMPDM